MSIALAGNSYADECSEKVLVSQTSVEYLVGARNNLESQLIMANTTIKKLNDELAAIKKDREDAIEVKGKNEKNPDKK
jgi:hypothetical protein